VYRESLGSCSSSRNASDGATIKLHADGFQLHCCYYILSPHIFYLITTFHWTGQKNRIFQWSSLSPTRPSSIIMLTITLWITTLTRQELIKRWNDPNVT